MNTFKVYNLDEPVWKKFMSKESLEKLLANNNLKLSLAEADYILNSEYYQDYYNEKMAEDIVNKL